MSGGKGGGSTSKVEIPQWAEDATKKNLARSEAVQRMGYMPYMGPDVAAFNPLQVAAMQSAADAGAAFGLASPMNVSSSIPQSQTFAGGIQGYSSAPLFEESVGAAREKYPEQMAAYDRLHNTYYNPVGSGMDVPAKDITMDGGFIPGISGFGGAGSNFNALAGAADYVAPFDYASYFSSTPDLTYMTPQGGGYMNQKYDWSKK